MLQHQRAIFITADQRGGMGKFCNIILIHIDKRVAICQRVKQAQHKWFNDDSGFGGDAREYGLCRLRGRVGHHFRGDFG